MHIAICDFLNNIYGMSILINIGLVLLAVIILTGIVRIIFSPFRGIGNLFMDLLLLDMLGDLLSAIIESLLDID